MEQVDEDLWESWAWAKKLETPTMKVKKPTGKFKEPLGVLQTDGASTNLSHKKAIQINPHSATQI